MTRRRSIRLRAVVAAATAALLVASTAPVEAGGLARTAAPRSNEQGVVEATVPTVGAFGGIALVGDSLLVGSTMEHGSWGPTVARLLADRGWGPVRSRAGVGFQTGRTLPSTSPANLGTWLAQQPMNGFDPSVVLVNLGTNDINSCRGSSACAFANIRYLMDIIGPDRQVWWSMISVPDPEREQTWNDALRAVAAQRPNLILWDWPAVQDAEQVPMAPDGIHLQGAAAYRQRSVLIADDVTARLGTPRSGAVPLPTPVAAPPATTTSTTIDPTTATTIQVTTTTLPAPTTTSSTTTTSTTSTTTTTTTTLPDPFTPDLPDEDAPLLFRVVEPLRVVDTRTDASRLQAGETIVVDLTSAVSAFAGSAAVAVNVTSADADGTGHLTVWPCGTRRPGTSALNVTAGHVRSSQTLTMLGADDEVCVFTSVATDVVVDLQGVFVDSGGDRFDPLLPARVLDTRQTGRKRLLTIAAPAGVSAVAMTITVTGGVRPGFVVAYGCTDAPPLASTVNWQPLETVAGATFAPVGPSGLVCLAMSSDADVVVDVTGTFAPDGRLRFTPAEQARMIDTRSGAGRRVEPVGDGATMSAVVAPALASAVSGTLTIVGPQRSGYLTATVCGSPPGMTSTVHAPAGAVAANGVTVAVSAGGELCVQAHRTADVVFDVSGWWSE